MDFITQTKEVPVVGSYDVVVCGGGPAGLIAAIAAARGGARTALVERYGFLGGMATAGLVAPISVFNYNGRRIVGGIPWEFVERLAGIGGAEEEKPLGNITFSPEKYKLVAQRMLLEAGVTLYFHSYLTGCRTARRGGSRTSSSRTRTAPRRSSPVTSSTPRATPTPGAAGGRPDAARGTTLQPASLIFMLGGVDTDALPMLRHSRQGVNYHDLAIREALEALREREEVPLFGGPWYCGVLTPGVVLVNMTRTQADMADNREATAAECLLHEHVHLFTELLRRHVPAFRNASLLATATQTGVRETRRIRGFHTLTGEEYLHAVDFPDAVSRGCHPVDIHAASSTGQRCEFLKEAAFIPYRCLIAPGFPNLLVAGRSFSADAVASASVRVQASVMGLGQAAGAAAAQCVRSGVGVAEIDVGQLRRTLVEYGANLTA